MPGRQLADAFVTISPDTRLFRSMTDAQIRKELAGFNPKIRIGADTKTAQAAITALQARTGDLSKQLSALRADVSDKAAEARVVSLQGKVLALARQMKDLTMAADTKKLDAQIVAKQAELRKLEAQMSGLQMDADDTKLSLKIAIKEEQAKRLEEQLHDMDMDADVSVLEAKFNAVHAELALLKRDASKTDLAMSNVAALRNIAVVKADLASLQEQARNTRLGVDIDPVKLLAFESALLGIEHTVSGLGKKDVPDANTAMGVFFRSMDKGSTAAAYGWRILTGHITLFGGALNKVLPAMFTSVAVWHLLIDAAIEIVAVWAPAIVAMTAFGVAGYRAATEVYQRMVAVHTVMAATGQAVPPLSNAFSNLASAVRPEVYQLFGDALVVMNKRSGAFNTVATSTGHVVDMLAARFVYAVTTGGTVNKFMEHAVEDVARLGDSIGNLGGIFGAVFRAVPGYAEILLQVGDGITKVLEVATQAAEPVIAVGLALHGFFIYGGAAVTVSLALTAGIVKLFGAFGKFNEAVTLVGLNALKKFALGTASAITGAVQYSGALLDLARKESAAGAASIALKDAQSALGKIPTAFWAVAAAAALATLVHAIVSSKDAAQQFNATIQQTIQNAPLANVATVIQQAQAVTAAHLTQTTRQLNQAIKENTVVNAGRAGALNSNGTAIQNLDNAQRHYAQGLGQLNDQQKLVISRFAGLSNEYHGQTQALGALTAAGITTGQILDTNKDHWAQALIQVHATTAAYMAMGTQAGVLGNDLDVLGRTETSQYQATQKLNQAWSQFITDVTGTQGSLDTVIQGFETLDTHSGELKLSLGKLKTAFADGTASIKSQGAVASATAAVATAQQALNKLQSSGKASAEQLIAAHARLTAAQDRLTVAQNNLASAQKQGTSAIDALTPAGVALNQAFGEQVQNVDKLFASWRTAGIAGNLFTEGVKAAIVPMVKYAGGSKEATAQLVALAEEAGYQGPVSLASLNKWLGNTHGSTQRLKDITNQATIQEALLTGAMQSQANFIATQLNRDLTQAVLAYSGVESAVKAYGTAVARSGKDSADAKSKLTAAVNAIVKSELSLGDNANQMAAVVSKTFGISMPAAFALVKTSLGNLADKTVPGAKSQFRTFAEVGLDYTKAKANDLWNEIVSKLGPKMNDLGDLAKGPVKAKFIDWAMNGLHLTQQKAQALWREVDTLQQHINGLHGKDVTLSMIATGSGGVKVTASQQGIAAKLIALNRLGMAEGGFISGGSPGKDSVPAMLMPGEVVVPTAMVQGGAVDHLRGKLPGFAGGGAVGSVGNSGIGTIKALESKPAAYQEATSKAVTADAQAAMAADGKAVINAMIKQMLAGSGPAVLAYAMQFLHKVPYVWGGSTPSGWDCSGMVSYVYDHFKLFSGRTDAAGLQRWAKPSSPTPGGMAFYGSPAHHVGFVVDNHTLLSALGTKWGTTLSSLNMGDNSGYGIPPQGFGTAGGGGGGSLPLGKLQELAFSMLASRGWGLQWPSFNRLETREAGWRMNAVNPASGAAGLAQFIHGWSEYYTYGGNPNTAQGQLTAMINYIAQRYPSGPNEAWAHEVVNNWYAHGGLVRKMAAGGAVGIYDQGGILPPGGVAVNMTNRPEQVLSPMATGGLAMAAGGMIPLAKYLPQLKTAQRNEAGDYAGLRNSYLKDLKAARKGSWTSGHRAGITSELATLAKRQSAEVAAYNAIIAHGTSKANLTSMASKVKAVATTSRDKDLVHNHPGWTHGLQYWLGVLTHLASSSVAPVYGGAQAKQQFATWIAKARADQAHEVYDYKGLQAAFKAGLSHASHSSWLYKNRKGIGERLYAVAIKQNAEAAAWNDLNKHATGSVSDLAGLAGRIGKLGAQAKAEAGSLQPSLLGHTPGGHPGWVKALQAQLNALTKLAAAPPYNPPWAPGNLGPSHTAIGGVLRFDTGRGVLLPGMNLAWNGTGRPEALSRSGAGAPQAITLEFAGGGSDLEQLLFQIIRRTVRVRGGGNVQTAYGRPLE